MTNGGSGFRNYGYDGNGNATSDGQGNTIDYNMLNLPQNVAGKSLAYTFDAAGRKLRKVSGTKVTEYIDGIQYDGTTIDFVQTEEGRVLNPAATPNYEYTLTDHLGNNRSTFDSYSGTSSPKQQDDYYPFGLEITHVQSGTKNEYLYNKKELQEELTRYDYGARFYDPVIARWTTIDRFAEKYDSWSSYVYVQNNPIKSIDIKGDTIVNAASPGSEEYKATANALGVLKQTNSEAYNTLQNSTTNYNISYQADLKSDDGQDLNGLTEINYNHSSWNATATTDAKGNITGGTFIRGLNSEEQEALRAQGVDPKGQVKTISEDEANKEIKIKGDVTIKLNSSLLSDQKQLTVTLAHEFGHGAFSQLHAAVAKLWGLIGKPSALGHDKNNPSGNRAKEEEKKASDNYDRAKQ